MEKQKEIIDTMWAILDRYLIAPKGMTDEVIRKRYSGLSDTEFSELRGRRLLCTGFALALENALKKKGIPCRHLFVYQEPFVLDGLSKNDHTGKAVDFNKRYLSLVKAGRLEDAEKEVSALVVDIRDRHSVRRHVHCVVEVTIGNQDLMVDPTAGLFYNLTKEELIRGADIFKSYLYFDQIDYLLSNIHVGMTSLIYTTHLFWRNVYHISSFEKSIGW